jgi:MFS family permease
MKRRPLILIALLLAAFVINLDTTIVNVALPSLVRQLHASDSQLQWVVDAFNLLFAGSVLAAGSLSDRFGRKEMLLAGLSVFGVASLAGGLMDSPGALIAARAVMGVGAAMVFPSTLSLITNVFTERGERARAIGLWGAITGVAIALGPIVAAGCSSSPTGAASSSRWCRSPPAPVSWSRAMSRPRGTRTRPAPTAPDSRCQLRWSGCSSTRSSRRRTTVGAAPGRSPASR